MDTAGEAPAKRVRKTHLGRRSAAAQKKRDQRNEQYYPGSFAFVWLARIVEQQIAMLLQQVMEMNERMRQRGSCRTSETTAGSPQDSWADAGRANEPDGSESERYVSS